MKTILALLVATALGAAAGTLRDDANLFGPDASRVNAALANTKVWVETLVKRPDNIKSYADTRISQLGDGFIIIITTQPKAWRISMQPVGLAASPRTEAVGSRMAAKFKQGKMAEAVIVAAAELTELTKPASAFPWFWVIGGVVIFGGFGSILFVWMRGNLLEKRERERREAEAREAEESARRARRQEERRLREVRSRPAPRMEAPPPPPPPPQPPPQAGPANPYANMSTEQRREVVHHYVHDHRYNDGLLSDPVAFLLFMNMMENQSQNNHPFVTMMQQPQPQPVPMRIREPDPEPQLERPTRSYRSEPEPERSRSDESGSSGGWSSDSSSTSDGGNSGSDSSGSGGDW